jgi:hypothetical protein
MPRMRKDDTCTARELFIDAKLQTAGRWQSPVYGK